MAKKSDIYRGPVDDYFAGSEDAAFNRGGKPFRNSGVSSEGRSASADKADWESLPGGKPSPRQLGQRAVGRRELSAAERRAAAERELAGSPRPAAPDHSKLQPPPAPMAPPKALGPPYSTSDVVGRFEVGRDEFDAISGNNPTPRHELPPEPSETQGPFPAPLD
jgi:hypothetical protein